MSGPKFFSLRGAPAWRRGRAMHLSVAEDGLSLPKRDVYRPVRRDALDSPSLARPLSDAAVGRDGRWLVLDAVGGVWKFDLASGYAESLLPPGHGWFGNEAALAALGDTWVAADPAATPALLMLSSDHAQVLWTKADWSGEPFRALAVATDPEDRTVALASFPNTGERRLLRFAPSGEELDAVALTVPTPREPAEDAEASERAGASAAERSEASAAERAGASATERPGAGAAERKATGDEERRRFELSLDAGGDGWLLDRETQQVARIRFADKETSFRPLPAAATPAAAIRAERDGSLWVVRIGGSAGRRSLVRVNEDGEALETGDAGIGGARRLVGGADRRMVVWDRDEPDMTTVRPSPETSVWEPFQRRSGVWIGEALDSGSIETEWHRIVVDAEAEPDTQIRIRYYASDLRQAVVGGRLVDVDRFVADEGIDPKTKLDALRPLWSEPIVDPRDALLFRAKGRYLWLCAELIGSEKETPLVRGIEVHFPRKTYVDDLPALYQNDPKSKDFLDRYLSLFQTVMAQTDRAIAEVPRAFDPDASSGPSLRWLLGWLGLEADDRWTEPQLRELLRHAPTLSKRRGTRYALETLVRIYTGESPIILEHEQLQPLLEHPELGDVADKLYATDPHGFTVLVKPEYADTETKRIALQHLIDSFTPAYAAARLVVLQPWVYMDLHSYLGMNTVLSEPTLLTLDGLSSMPHHTITIDVGQDNRVDQHTRLGLDSRLE